MLVVNFSRLLISFINNYIKISRRNICAIQKFLQKKCLFKKCVECLIMIWLTFQCAETKMGSIGLSSVSQTTRRFRARCRRTHVLSRKHNSCLNTSVINRTRGARPPDVCCTGDAIMNGLYSSHPFIGSMRGLVAMGLVRRGCIQSCVYCKYVPRK